MCSTWSGTCRAICILNVQNDFKDICIPTTYRCTNTRQVRHVNTHTTHMTGLFFFSSICSAIQYETTNCMPSVVKGRPHAALPMPVVILLFLLLLFRHFIQMRYDDFGGKLLGSSKSTENVYAFIGYCCCCLFVEEFSISCAYILYVCFEIIYQYKLCFTLFVFCSISF